MEKRKSVALEFSEAQLFPHRDGYQLLALACLPLPSQPENYKMVLRVGS